MRVKVTAVLLCLLVGLAVGLFLYFFETHTSREDQGWSRDAIREPYLAAQRFLQGQGVVVETTNRVREIAALNRFGTLIIDDSSHVLTTGQVDDLISWVEAGGHLIVAAESAAAENPDPLMQMLELERYETNCDCEPGGKNSDTDTETDSDSDTHPDKDKDHRAEMGDRRTPDQSDPAGDAEATDAPDRTLSETLREYNRRASQGIPDDAQEDSRHVRMAAVAPDRLSLLNFEGYKDELRIYFEPDLALYHPFFEHDSEEDYPGLRPFYWGGHDFGVAFMQFELNRGLISVLSDANIWRSENIALFDHAYLLTILADTQSPVMFLTGSQMPSLAVLIWQHAREALLAGCLCLLAWLIYRGRRFGPAKSLQGHAGRSVGEHIRAAGHFFWRHGHADRLTGVLIDDIERRARCTLAAFEQAEKNDDVREKCEILARHCGVDLEDVQRAMRYTDTNREEGLTAVIQTLQLIRKKL